LRVSRCASTILALATLLTGACQRQQPASGSPAAADATDTYLWLEDVHGAAPLAWAKQQNEKTRSVLASRPGFKKDYDTLLALHDASDRIPDAILDHQYAFNFWQDAQHVKGVWRRTGISDYASKDTRWEVLLDLDHLAAAEKENWVWKGADCAPSLTRCLVSLSRGGGDAKVVREFDLRTKAFLADGFSVKEAKTEAAYVDDDSILVATDFGAGTMTASGYARIAKLWRRGQPLAAAVQAAEARPTDVGVWLSVSRSASGNYALLARSPSFFENEYLAIGADGTSRNLPIPLTSEVKGVVQGHVVFKLLKPWTPATSTAGGGAPATFAAGSLLAFSFDAWSKTGQLPPVSVLHAPDQRTSLKEVVAGRDAVYVSILDNVIGSVRVLKPQGRGDQSGRVDWKEARLALPANGSASIASANSFGPEVLVRFESFLVPPTILADQGGGAPVAIRSVPPRFDASRLVSEQFSAISKDGTRVPYFVVRSRDHHGPRPTLLMGYGGYEIPLVPAYLETLFQVWVQRGGSLAVANIRGGGEFGPSWHDAAVGVNRQKSFDDFAAIAKDLSTRGVTTPKQLAILGASNGGLLVATVMTQQPDLLGAVICAAPLTDMLRYTKIGAGASWIGEYGDPADPTVAAALRAYSPYQHVTPGRRYPPILFVTATSDDRVTPVHARKMAARMAAQGHEVLYYENTDGGHGPGDHKQSAELDAFILHYLALKLGSAATGTAP